MLNVLTTKTNIVTIDEVLDILFNLIVAIIS